jgi:hypothetical protein
MRMIAVSEWTKPLLLWFSALLLGVWMSASPAFAYCPDNLCSPTPPGGPGPCPNYCVQDVGNDHYYYDSYCSYYYYTD